MHISSRVSCMSAAYQLHAGQAAGASGCYWFASLQVGGGSVRQNTGQNFRSQNTLVVWSAQLLLRDYMNMHTALDTRTNSLKYKV